MDVAAVKSSVREQFDRNVGHYLHASPMADRELLQTIVGLADPGPGDRTLDVACGAGFLVCAFARQVQYAVGVDLSDAMLTEARKNAGSLGLANTRFQSADAEALPFDNGSFDLISCKLAFHYFPDPERAIGEMKRVVKKGGRLVLVDRVSSEDREKQAYHNRIELLRTPTKVKVYAASEIEALLRRQGLQIEQVRQCEQVEDFGEWIRATGAPEKERELARELMLDSVTGDLAGLNVRLHGEQLMMTHATAILVAKRP